MKQKIRKTFSRHGIIKYHALEVAVLQKLSAAKKDI